MVVVVVVVAVIVVVAVTVDVAAVFPAVNAILATGTSLLTLLL